MTVMQEKAMQRIQELSDEKLTFLVEFMDTMQTVKDNTVNKDDSIKAFNIFTNTPLSLPPDFDYKNELLSAREAHYENLG